MIKLDREAIEEIASAIARREAIKDKSLCVPVGVSNRHMHISQRDLEHLFGPGYCLRFKSLLKQPGQFAAEETVTIAGPKGFFPKVRILGPLREKSQIEISRTDAYTLGINPPVRASGDLKGAPEICVMGPKGMLVLKETVICAQRHIHLPIREKDRFGLEDGDLVEVETLGEKQVIFSKVLVRATEKAALELHLDTDEANGAEVKNNDFVRIIGKNR